MSIHLPDNYKLDLTFRKGVEFTITGPGDKVFLIETYETLANESIPRIIDSTLTMSNWPEYRMYRNWHGNFMVKVYDWQDGIRLLHTETLQMTNKHVLFISHALNEEEQRTWLNQAAALAKKQGFKHSFIRVGQPFDPTLYYRIYDLGRFVSDQPTTLHEWPNRQRQIWRQYFNEFNPRDWKDLTIEEVFNDIAGVTENHYHQTFTIKSMYL